MDIDGNFVTKHDSALPSIFSAHPRVLPVPLWRGNMTETFLSSGFPLKLSSFMALMYRESAFALKISCWKLSHSKFRTSTPRNSRLSPPVLKHFLLVLHYLNQDGAEVHILSGAPLSSSYLIVCMFFSHICSASHPLPFGRGLPGGKVKITSL